MKLNIQLFATSGTINGTSTSSNCSTRIVWKETSRDLTNRTITLKVSVQIYKSGSSSTTGTFSGTLNINGASYSISKKFSPYKWGSWAEVDYKYITISNASNKSVPISTTLTQTGTSMAGTYKASGYAQLDTLFDAPVITDITIQETNSNLIGKVANNVFVDNLSIKSFQITATLDASASATKYSIYNNSTPYSSNNNTVVLNCVNNDLSKNTDGTIPIRARVLDSNESVGFSDTINYQNIPYTVVNLVETSTLIKRNGQTSGRAFLNAQGTYYNKSIGTVNQSGTYKPTIKYKYWEYGTTEPSTFNNTVLSSNITVNNGIFSITNLEIGTTTESATNYFNPEKAYRFKIQVNDNFTTYVSTEKSISVGEYLWGEFKDRVDFKKITIKHEPILMPYILFEGSSYSNITLSDNASNYKYMEIYYCNVDNSSYTSMKVPNPNGKTIQLSTDYDNGTYLYHSVSVRTINGTAFNKTSEIRWRYGTTPNITRSANTNDIRIGKIIGYK